MVLGKWGGEGRGGGRRVSPCAHLLIFIIVARSIALFIQRELGRWGLCCGGGGGGGGRGERARRATITGKLAIDLNNGVKVINHSQLLELSLIYIYASFAHD